MSLVYTFVLTYLESQARNQFGSFSDKYVCNH